MGPLFFYFDRCHFHSNGGSRTGYFFLKRIIAFVRVTVELQLCGNVYF